MDLCRPTTKLGSSTHSTALQCRLTILPPSAPAKTSCALLIPATLPLQKATTLQPYLPMAQPQRPHHSTSYRCSSQLRDCPISRVNHVPSHTIAPALESGGRSMSAETLCNPSAHCGRYCTLALCKMASGFCSRTLSVCAFGRTCLSTFTEVLWTVRWNQRPVSEWNCLFTNRKYAISGIWRLRRCCWRNDLVLLEIDGCGEGERRAQLGSA